MTPLCGVSDRDRTGAPGSGDVLFLGHRYVPFVRLQGLVHFFALSSMYDISF